MNTSLPRIPPFDGDPLTPEGGREGFRRGLAAERDVARAIREAGWPDVASVEVVPRGDPRDGQGVDIEVHLRCGGIVRVQVKARRSSSSGYGRYLAAGIVVLFANDIPSALLRLRSWIDRKEWQRRMYPIAS